MFRNPTIIDRSNDQASGDSSKIVSSTPVSESGFEPQTVPLLPDTGANPEFAKWWRRWASRVRRISVRKNPRARRIKIDPPNSDPKASRLISAECEFKRYL